MGTGYTPPTTTTLPSSSGAAAKQKAKDKSDPFGLNLGAAGPPPPGGSTSTYIGIPNNYDPGRLPYGYPGTAGFSGSHEPLYPGGPQTDRQIPAGYPGYQEGDQYRPRNLSSDQIWATQQTLAKMGLLSGPFLPRVWDQATADAYKAVLGYANQHGISDEQAMIELGNSAKLGLMTVDAQGNVIPAGSAAAQRAPLVTHLTDPKILKPAFRQIAINDGVAWNEDQVNTAVMAYNALEKQRQQQAYDAQVKGGTVYDVPDPQSYMDAYVRDLAPGAVAEHDALGFASEAMGLMNSPAWSA